MTTQEIRQLQTSIEQSTIRRAADLTMAEQFKLGADFKLDPQAGFELMTGSVQTSGVLILSNRLRPRR
ncbi:MAG: hypothetical protein FJ295_20870 [Planctomycetes bacterium]|nr:hypothetical protein [Planctomycetota bacterium]